jgi:hypothetical protein
MASEKNLIKVLYINSISTIVFFRSTLAAGLTYKCGEREEMVGGLPPAVDVYGYKDK